MCPQVDRLRTRRPWQSEWISKTHHPKIKIKFGDVSLTHSLFISLSQSSLSFEPQSACRICQNKPPQVISVCPALGLQVQLCSCGGTRVWALTNTSLLLLLPGFHQRCWKRPLTLTESVSSPSTRWGSSSRVRRLFNKRTFLQCPPHWFNFKTAPFPPPESTKRANQMRQEKILAIKKLHILERHYLVTAIKTPPTEDLCGSNL